MTRPLAGCRIIDFGIITAGAATSALLAELGADVIKIESPSYQDPFRVWPFQNSAGDAVSPFFRSNNRGKRAISIDLKRKEGREALLRLVANSHVVLENFRRGVLDRLGLDLPTLKIANPNIILLSISSQGVTGPDAGQVSFGSTLEAVGGLASVTGYDGAGPVVSGRELNYPDQVVALFAAGAVLAAWLARAKGAVLDVCQRELTSFMLGETFLASDTPGRRGNAEPPFLLQDCFRTGDGRWIAVSVAPQDLPSLRACVDSPAQLAAWIAAGTATERLEALAQAGIAAAPVHDSRDIARTDARFALQRLADGGLVKGSPFRMKRPAPEAADAPAAGQHTASILQSLAGYDPATIADLAARGVIQCAEAASGQMSPRSPMPPALT